MEAEGGGGENRGDKFFGDDGHQEDAAEDGESLVEELEEIDGGVAWVFELVAEGGTEGVVNVVGEGEVFGKGDAA